LKERLLMKHFGMKKLFVSMICIALMLPALTVGAASPTSKPASDLRAGLSSMLAEHAMLAVITMQKGVDGADDFGDAAAALGKNTEDLTAAITSVFGADAGEAFNGLWSGHIGFFVDYVTATAENDEAGRQAALDNLANYKEDFSGFLAGATKIPQGDLASGLQMHVDQLVTAFDSYVNEDYDAVYTNLRSAYAHMYQTGGALAGAIAKEMPDKFSGDPNSDAVNLRIALDRLLSEHAFLAVIAMQKGVDGAADFGAIAGALGENTEDLTAAISSVFGADAGEAFNGLWSGHIGFFVDYVTSTAGNDEAGRQAALDNLANYKEDFSGLLSGATKIPQGDLAAGLQAHVDQLVAAFDSYVDKDYAAAYTNLRTAYHHMMMTGDALAGAIIALESEETTMPEAMPKTGMGGTSPLQDTNSTPLYWYLSALLFTATTAGWMIRKKQENL
jgi:hypothetical protein